NTDAAPVSCANVDIRLSTDGGFTYPVSIEAGVPNDGSEQVLVPEEITTTARIQVMCSNNVFFDISNANFTIEQGEPVASLSIGKSVDPTGAVSPGDVLTYTVAVTNSGSLTATASITDTFAAVLTGVTCNGVPGDLDVVESIEPAGQASFECTAEVDPGLAIELSKTVDQAVVNAGETVTYTLTVTNPHGSATLTDVLVTDPDVGTCTPALGIPFDLGPGDSQTFVCPDVVVTETVTNTANVTAELLIENQAQASAPEDPAGVVSSEVVSSPVALAASASATVEVSPQGPVYHVFLPLSVRND
ncbi:MAG TPA: hypothetical protein VJ768_09945, partial [Anaerolineales bacterium]|nr:hypothetical protein [Anaerolineales bacterium]